MRPAIWLIVWTTALSAAQLAAYLLGRGIGDFAFLAFAVSLPIVANLAARSQTSWLMRALWSAGGTAAAYALLAAFTLWVRGEFLGITEPYGQSALFGMVWIVIFGICIMLALLITVLWQIFCRKN